MIENILAKLFEHNIWANDQIIQACSALSDAQLDAEPQSITKGTIRETLQHLVRAQAGYLALLTLTVEARVKPSPAFSELRQAARISGEGLLALAGGEHFQQMESRLQTKDGYFVQPWVVMLQVINHAGEHREQIKSMLSALGVTPPDIDGWDYGDFTGALIPMQA